MHDNNQSNQAGMSAKSTINQKPYPQKDDGDRNLEMPSIDRQEYPFSRELIKSIIDRIKEG